MSPATQIHAPADTVRALYEAFARRDVEAVLTLLSEDVEIFQSEELPWGGTYRGHEGALRFFGALAGHIETQLDIDRIIVAGDSVVENGRTCGRALSTGRTFAIDETHVFRVRDGRIASMQAYVDNAAMLHALAAD